MDYKILNLKICNKLKVINRDKHSRILDTLYNPVYHSNLTNFK